jgi:hypothetical protein
MSRQLSFTDYDGFVDKFKPKKTTDDCYTPPAVFEAVLDYVNRNVTPLEGREVVRPFWPGGDYERHEYPKGCIVVDNPPFSITAQIARFYIRHGVDFFLFCDGLTCMNNAHKNPQVAFHIINKSVTFENGAVVSLAFVTNVRPHGERIVLAGELEAALRVACKQPNKEKKKLVYPQEVVSGALLKKFVSLGRNVAIGETQCAPIARHEAPFGGGFMVSSQVAEELQRERERERERELERELERERLAEHRPMSPAFHEMLRRLNASAPTFKITP